MGHEPDRGETAARSRALSAPGDGEAACGLRFAHSATDPGGAACPQDALSSLGTTRSTNVFPFRKSRESGLMQLNRGQLRKKPDRSVNLVGSPLAGDFPLPSRANALPTNAF